MRTLVSCVLIAAALGCGGGGSTPTAPTALPSPPPIVSSRCTPSASARVHTVPVPGASTPVTVWIDGTTPPPGATVRVGEFAQVSYGYLTPAGFTTSVQTFVGDELTRGVFASVTTGGCGGGFSATPIPRTNGPLRVWLRVWVTPGPLRPGDAMPDTQRPPDYEASELADWTVLP
jgi:hypothetical protein